MSSLRIPIETPPSLCDIDFRALASEYCGQIDVVTDLEGTVVPWSRHAGDARVGSDIAEALADATYNGYLCGTHAITNRGGRGGAYLTDMFTRAITAIAPSNALDCHTAYPRSRAERKPSGILSQRIVRAITRDRLPSEVVIAFIGDKFSDMKEAEILHRTTDIPVVGFMVERYGATDHPLDTIFGKRQQATARREGLKTISRDRFIKR